MPKKILLIFLSAIFYVNSYKILVYSPKFGISHVDFMGKIADILAKAGHDVVVYQPVYNENITRPGANMARVIERSRDFEPPVHFYSKDRQNFIWSTQGFGFVEETQQLWQTGNMFYRGLSEICKHEVKDLKLMEQLRGEKFDLIMGERNCFYAVAELLGIQKHITIYSSAMIDPGSSYLGIPTVASFIPGSITGDLPFSYMDKLKNMFSHISIYLRYTYHYFNVFDRIIREITHDRTNYIEKIAQSAFFFVNVDEHMEFPRPISHKIVYIGGIGQATPKPLSEEYAEIMDKSKKGVVLVSFGTAAQSHLLPPEMKAKFLETFAAFPDVTFLWKYDIDDGVADGHKNVITKKWLPQTDLLGHPKLLAFITHGGQNSISEATASGVPLICIPIFGDQFRNARLVKYRKIGLMVTKSEILEGKIEDSLRELFHNPIYQRNAKRMGDMIREKPMTPEERIVKYTEFAAEFGNDNNLDMSGRNLNFFEFYCLDIILPFILGVVLILFLFLKFCMFMARKICSLFIGKPKTKRE